MNICCIVCARDGIETAVRVGNQVCELHYREALAAIVAADMRTKTAILPLSIADRKARRVRASKARAV